MVFDSINNCPIVLFYKVVDTGNFSLLGHESKKKNKKAWRAIKEEFLNEYGVTKEFRKQYATKLEIVGLKEAIWRGEKWKEPLLLAKQFQLSELEGGKGSGNIYQNLAFLSKYMGFQLDDKTTIRQYYIYLEIANKNS